MSLVFKEKKDELKYSFHPSVSHMFERSQGVLLATLSPRCYICVYDIQVEEGVGPIATELCWVNVPSNAYPLQALHFFNEEVIICSF